MSQRVLSSSFLASCLLAGLTACGSNDASPDAGVQIVFDAAPDACSGMVCDNACIDTDFDKAHCGSCDNECQSGAICDDGSCMCPDFIPATRTQPLQDMVIPPNQSNIADTDIALGPFATAAGFHVLAVAYPTTNVMIGSPYTLTTPDANNLVPPFVGAGYNLNLSTFQPEAAFIVTAGSLTFSEACSTGAKGVLTNATFQAVSSLLNPMVDADGCTYSIPSLTFEIGTDCAPPP